jgi:hypothetical protein
VFEDEEEKKMSVAPELAPEIVIPDRARRTSRGLRSVRVVNGNVIAPALFVTVPSGGNRPAPLCLVPSREVFAPGDTAPVEGWSAPSFTQVRPLGRPAHAVPVPPVRRSPSTPGERLLGEPAAPVRRGSAHLTTRGRLVLAAAGGLAALGIVIGAWFGAAGSSAAPAAPVPPQVVVHDGDTLWSIATAVAPQQDPRLTVDRLRDLNNLTGVDLVPGQVLRTR